jgi:hypothetical protein
LATTSYIGGAQTSKHFLPFLLYIAILCTPASSVLQEALVNDKDRIGFCGFRCGGTGDDEAAKGDVIAQ